MHPITTRMQTQVVIWTIYKRYYCFVCLLLIGVCSVDGRIRIVLQGGIPVCTKWFFNWRFVPLISEMDECWILNFSSSIKLSLSYGRFGYPLTPWCVFLILLLLIYHLLYHLFIVAYILCVDCLFAYFLG